jgi:hypothetical protein
MSVIQLQMLLMLSFMFEIFIEIYLMKYIFHIFPIRKEC